jgi:hypothetical protein
MGVGFGGRHGVPASRGPLCVRSLLRKSRQDAGSMPLLLQDDGNSRLGRLANDDGPLFAGNQKTVLLQRDVLERVQLQSAVAGVTPAGSPAAHRVCRLGGVCDLHLSLPATGCCPRQRSFLDGRYSSRLHLCIGTLRTPLPDANLMLPGEHCAHAFLESRDASPIDLHRGYAAARSACRSDRHL